MDTDRAGAVGVLLADDDPTVLAALSELVALDARLALVAAVDDGDRAVAIACRERPDVAVVDVRMPGGGPGLVRRLRAASERLAIVAHTAHGDPVTEREMRDAGADAFVVKGARHVDLAGTIAAVIRPCGPDDLWP